MPKVCFVPGCKTGLMTDRAEKKKKGERLPTLFSPPHDPVLFEKWKEAITGRDRELSHKDFVCELHFSEDDVIKYFFDVKLSEEKVWKVERGRHKLKNEVVPSINLSKPDLRKKLYSSQTAQQTKTVTDLVNGSEYSCQSQEGIGSSLFSTLRKDISALNKVPWTISQKTDSIALVKWNDDFSIERWIVIYENMTVRVFLKGVITTAGDDFLITCFDDVEDLINKVEDLVICSEADYQNPKCWGFLDGDDELKAMDKCKSCRRKKKVYNAPRVKNKSNLS